MAPTWLWGLHLLSSVDISYMLDSALWGSRKHSELCEQTVMVHEKQPQLQGGQDQEREGGAFSCSASPARSLLVWEHESHWLFQKMPILFIMSAFCLSWGGGSLRITSKTWPFLEILFFKTNLFMETCWLGLNFQQEIFLEFRLLRVQEFREFNSQNTLHGALSWDFGGFSRSLLALLQK